MDSNTNSEPDFLGALEEEFGIEPESTTTTAEPTAATAEEKTDVDEAPEAVDGEQVPAVVDAEAPAVAEPATPQGDDEPKLVTKADVIEAMREYNAETKEQINQLSEAKTQIIESLHPEGIDRNIYDSNGEVIKTAQDIVDRGLLNPNTNSEFTYEEAASFMLEAGRKMAENVAELDKWAEDIAEKNISLIESNQRVMDKWGDVIKAMPNRAKEWADEYIKTQLEFDKTGSYITKMNMSPETYYSRVAGPYRELAESMARQEEYAAKLKTYEQTTEQNERMGLPPQRGSSDVKSNTGDPMLDALMDEMKKG